VPLLALPANSNSRSRPPSSPHTRRRRLHATVHCCGERKAVCVGGKRRNWCVECMVVWWWKWRLQCSIVLAFYDFLICDRYVLGTPPYSQHPCHAHYAPHSHCRHRHHNRHSTLAQMATTAHVTSPSLLLPSPPPPLQLPPTPRPRYHDRCSVGCRAECRFKPRPRTRPNGCHTDCNTEQCRY
jgi:hypothetical protein